MAAEPSSESTGTGTTSAAQPALVAGGNPQIVKSDGDAPVQAYITAMPGWKRDVGKRLDLQPRDASRPRIRAGRKG